MAITVPPGFYDADSRKAHLATGQVLVSTAVTLVIPESLARVGLVVTNLGTSTVYLGRKNQVSTTDGHALLAGQSISIVSSHALWAVTASGTITVSYLEESLV